MTHQGQFSADRATMLRLFGESEQDGNYLLDINGRKAKVSKKHGDTWAVETENYRICARLFTIIEYDKGPI